MKKFKFYATALMFIMLFSSAAMANVWFVSTAGNNSWDGDSPTYVSGTTGPFRDIQYAIDTVPDGDLIYILDGQYFENLNFNGKSLILASEYFSGNGTSHIANTIIDGGQNGNVITIMNSEWALLIGLTIRNGLTSANGGGVNAYQCPRLFIDRCIIEDNIADTGGGISLYGTSANITRCIIQGNIAADDGGGIATSSSAPALGLDGNPDDRIVINNCLIVNNRADDAYGGMGGGGMRLISPDTRVMNCTISDNFTPNNNGGGISMYLDPIIINNIIWGNTGNDLDTYSGVNNPNVTYCDVGTGYPGTGNISDDPLFIGPSDYALSPTSPCINAGDPASAIPPLLGHDLDDIPRILGGRVDIGAYESETIILRPGATDGQDAHLSSLEPNLNLGDHKDLNAAAWTSGGQISNVRNVFQFAGLSVIPQGTQILSAKLSLFNNPTASNGFLNGEHSSYSGSNESVIQRVTSLWDEYSVTWDNHPTTTTQNQVTVPQSTSPHQDYEIDVTGLVQDMIYDVPLDRFGFMLKLKTEIRYRCLLFASSDHLDPNLHPMLTIELY
ncbi:MAG: DNRLRE domain-containing protein [Desulfobacteraceae bacterium]|nr:DNRLRE domain-containing protein [Desulfobacteraceae bacterium]